MKIQCDVCESQEATVFCSADEAALCNLCDSRIHTANKLAEKHLRFSLLSPSPTDSPTLCDICQERRAFLFCKEDRAILCTECDIRIHRVSEHTQRHYRFLLTGLKISPSSQLYHNSSHSCSNSTSLTSTCPLTISNSKDALSAGSLTTSYYNNNQYYQMGSDQEGSISTTDYNVDLIAVGAPSSWHVDDLFHSPFFTSKSIDYTQPSGTQQAESKYGYQYL